MDNKDFIDKLQIKYGKWKREASQFGNASYGDIANDLCYSNSHFTKLMSGSASEAMYSRAIKNVNTLIKNDTLFNELESLKSTNERIASEKNAPGKLLLSIIKYALPALALGFFISKLMNPQSEPIVTSTEISIDNIHPMARYFDREDMENFASPYLEGSEIQSYCPCSGFEGSWQLDKEYKFPLPTNKPGIYYVAKAADVRMKCQKGATGEEKGAKLLGFENIHNEIWIDKKRTPFSSKYFDKESKTYTQEFTDLKFEDNNDFIKIADVYSCFFDEFTISNEAIKRIGEPCGRYAKIHNKEKIKEYQIDIDDLLDNVIGNMSSVSCNSAINEFCNPNDLVEGASVFTFMCTFSINTENLGLGGGYPYEKGYRLVEQNYSSNLLCECE